jgi:hypothetical protein
MSPTATLIYVQNFFAWITQEALRGRPGIVDKYIGDEVMSSSATSSAPKIRSLTPSRLRLR